MLKQVIRIPERLRGSILEMHDFVQQNRELLKRRPGGRFEGTAKDSRS
jgi:hypothetical protein